MNIYFFKVSIGDERERRDKGIEIRALDIISALQKMEELVLDKESGYILTEGIGAKIIECKRIEDEVK